MRQRKKRGVISSIIGRLLCVRVGTLWTCQLRGWSFTRARFGEASLYAHGDCEAELPTSDCHNFAFITHAVIWFRSCAVFDAQAAASRRIKNCPASLINGTAVYGGLRGTLRVITLQTDEKYGWWHLFSTRDNAMAGWRRMKTKWRLSVATIQLRE